MMLDKAPHQTLETGSHAGHPTGARATLDTLPAMPPPVLERYLQISTATAAGHLVTGELGYLTDVTGLMQLWQVGADGLHVQLTFGTERVTAAQPSPTRRAWLVARDVGGDEKHALSLLDLDAQAETQLTDDPDAIHAPGAFSPDGGLVAFTHTERNGTDFDVALVAPDGSGRRELAQPGGACVVSDWSDAGILVWRANLPFDHDLLLVDPATGDTRHLTPHTGQVVYDSPRLLADGRVLCACDLGSEHARLAELDPDGTPHFRSPDDGDVEQIGLDATRAHRAWVTNQDGWSQLWCDGRPHEGLPHGVYGRPYPHVHGGLTITVEAATDGTDVWMLPGRKRCTRAPVGGIDRGTFVRPVLRSFESFDGRRIDYFLYGREGEPTLCWVHGGPESQFRPRLLPVVQYLAARGITVAAPNVRGSTGYGRTFHGLDDRDKRLDSVSDLASLARTLGAADGVKVAVMGGSYGGYMTFAAITEHPDLWAGAVSTVGIVNFVTFLERTSDYRRALREAEYGSLEHDRAMLERISPIHRVDRITAPLMVLHGARDPRVPVSEADQVVAAVRAQGGEVEYLRYEDEGHGIVRRANRLEAYPRVAAFLERHLGV